ncbi:MAG: GNAT family N-acetyltransferase, partial [Phycisphaeraceae bacterium]
RMPPRAASSSPTIRPFTEADLPFGLHLTTQANWNQLEADWRRLLALAPDGCFLAEIDRQPAGTAVAVTFGPVAWISMVLVDAAHRGQGIATALMQHVLTYLDRRHIPTVRLDATPQGEPIYRKLGFQPQFPLIRLHRPATSTPTPDCSAAEVRITIPTTPDPLITLDHPATRTNRRPLLEHLLQEHPTRAHLAERDNQPTGYLLTRPGRDAVQIGPAIATDPDTADHLLAHTLHQLHDTPAYIDIPADHTRLLTTLTAQGFTEQRRYTRMTRGPLIHEHLPHLLASSGPEKG